MIANLSYVGVDQNLLTYSPSPNKQLATQTAGKDDFFKALLFRNDDDDAQDKRRGEILEEMINEESCQTSGLQ